MIAWPMDPRRTWKRFQVWARNVSLLRKLALWLTVAAVASGIATVVSMTGAQSVGTDPGIVIFLLYLDAVLVLLLGAIVAWRLSVLWVERRRGLAGSGLHARLVVLFSLVAVTPAIVVAVFAALFLNFGIESWFSDRVRTALSESHAVAKSYLYEHKQSILAEIYSMANDLNRNAPALMRESRRFEHVLSTQAALRSLPEAVVVDSTGQMVLRSRLSLPMEFEPVSSSAISKADAGDIVILTAQQDDRVRAIVKLNRFVDAYLVVGRFVDPDVIEHMGRVEGAVSQYQLLEKRRESLQISFVMIFIVVALLLLLAAVWIGLNLATQLAQPISNLISAAERVRKGDLRVRVRANPGTDEIGTLTRAFNRMTRRLENQRRGLIDANRELDERRRFTETVLTGVSAGVIGLDGEGRIKLPNRSASELLATDLEANIGRDLREVVPEMSAIFDEATLRPDRLSQSEIRLTGAKGPQTLLVRVAAENVGGDTVGWVVTFDDITELLAAQRTAAWADIARRIAHEIKNPLTPIQLSAERLKRRYLKQISADPESFALCTETIIRQVEDIGRMVDDFSSFARMPQPSIRSENLVEICRQAVFLERTRHPETVFELELPETRVGMRCDSRQVRRALTNVLKNAAESIEGREPPPAEENSDGLIRLSLTQESRAEGSVTAIVVEDNGPGLPAEDRDRLTEPYVTTRLKGTGLGLAIVKKIMEDHGGDLILEDREEGGARVTLVFRSAPSETDDAEETKDMTEAEDPMRLATDIVAHGS